MNEFISIAHNIQYFSVTSEARTVRSTRGKSVIVVEGECTFPLPRVCPVCGGRMDVSDHHVVRLQHLELLGSITILEVKFFRVRCRFCSHRETQRIPFRSRSHAMTTRLENRVRIRLNQGATLKATSVSLGIHPGIVKEIDKERLEKWELLTRPHPTRNIGIDEFLLHKGHRYATVVIDIDRGRIIFLEEGKKKEQAEHFIRKMGREWMRHVEAVSMDMNANYASAFREYAPHVKIVYDKFHMVKLFNDSVITQIRRRLQNECDSKDDSSGYRLLKGSRFLVLSSRSTLREKEMRAVENNRRLHELYLDKGLPIPPGERLMKTGRERRLSDLLAANTELSVAYTLLEQFKYAYDVDSADVMANGLKQWYRLAWQSNVPEIHRFANTIKKHEDGIINRVMHRISSGIVEGINNMIKTLRRKSYGFRDTRYFFLKLMFESYFKKSSYLSPKILY